MSKGAIGDLIEVIDQDLQELRKGRDAIDSKIREHIAQRKRLVEELLR